MTVKKSSFLIILTLAVFFVPAMAFAAEANAEDATDGTLATLETSARISSTAVEPPEADQEAFTRDVLAAGDVKTAPIATVANTEGGSSVVHDMKVEGSVSKTSAETPTEKAAGASAEKEISSTLNTTEMQRRWKALFSKEKASDSVVYTVKSGDSLYVIAKRNHTTVDFIKKINNLKSDDIYPEMKLKIHTAPFLIRIDKSKNVLVLYSNDEAVKKYSVATGKKNCTPEGEFKITDKLVHPTWFKTGAILPPGSPKNALGTRWMGFDKPAYGIHGTIEPKSIGTQASEGCIRMLNEDVEELYNIVPVGTKVIIQD